MSIFFDIMFTDNMALVASNFKRETLDRSYVSPYATKNKEESLMVDDHPIPLMAINTCENRITCHTLHQMIHGQFADKVQQFVMLDARYTYEFEGGSVKGAQHVQDPDEAEALMQDYIEDDVVVVVFCEFSQKRGPRMYRTLKDVCPADRRHNLRLYLLHCGFETYHRNYPQDCDGYRKMTHGSFTEEFWAAEDQDLQLWMSRRCNHAAQRKLEFSALLSNDSPTGPASGDVTTPSPFLRKALPARQPSSIKQSTTSSSPSNRSFPPLFSSSIIYPSFSPELPCCDSSASSCSSVRSSGTSCSGFSTTSPPSGPCRLPDDCVLAISVGINAIESPLMPRRNVKRQLRLSGLYDSESLRPVKQVVNRDLSEELLRTAKTTEQSPPSQSEGPAPADERVPSGLYP